MMLRTRRRQVRISALPLLHLVPNMLTLLGLCAGMSSIRYAVDGRWDLLSLMRVSPLREVDALITFSKLADKGLISLE